MSRQRQKWELTLERDFEGIVPLHPWRWESPSSEDIPSLTTLLLKSYAGSVDDEGEGEAEALAALQEYLEREDFPARTDLSMVIWFRDEPVAACLVSDTQEKEALISYIFVHPTWKGKTLGRGLLLSVLAKAKDAGIQKAVAWITKENEPSERLFTSQGFVPAQP